MTWEPQPPPTVTVVAETPPVGADGLLWVNVSDPGRPTFHRWDPDEEQWVQVGAASTITLANEPPEDPRHGDVFYDNLASGLLKPDGSRE